jgi:RNA polymerase sigma-70 factor (ECF subfamily)
MPQNKAFDDVADRLRDGDGEVATAVFRRFVRQLVRLARKQIGPSLRHKVEAEDVVQSAYRSFFTRFRAGQFDVATWNELWGLLTVITLRKCINRVEYHQAQCRDVAREVSWPAGGQEAGRRFEAIDRAPTPDQAAALADTVARVLCTADPCDRPILELSLQGSTAPDISTRLHRAERTVRRVRERLKRRLESLLVHQRGAGAPSQPDTLEEQ